MKYTINKKSKSPLYVTENEQMKLNYNCPDDEKIGTGPGSCGGATGNKDSTKTKTESSKKTNLTTYDANFWKGIPREPIKDTQENRKNAITDISSTIAHRKDIMKNILSKNYDKTNADKAMDYRINFDTAQQLLDIATNQLDLINKSDEYANLFEREKDITKDFFKNKGSSIKKALRIEHDNVVDRMREIEQEKLGRELIYKPRNSKIVEELIIKSKSKK